MQTIMLRQWAVLRIQYCVVTLAGSTCVILNGISFNDLSGFSVGMLSRAWLPGHPQLKSERLASSAHVLVTYRSIVDIDVYHMPFP